MLLLSGFISAQNISVDSTQTDSLIANPIISLDYDLEEMQVFMLKEVMVFNRPEFNSWEEKKRYYILRRRTKKVYPYAILAAERLEQLDVRLSRIKSKSAKKKYIKIVNDYLEGEFAPTLKKFTQSEGRILLKLLYRQSGRTAFNIIKDYKSGWNAFWSNTTAKMFNLSLKAEYNPFKYKQDLAIESVLRESFENGSLEYESAFWESLDMNDPYFDPPVSEEK